ncbi:o-succinylbenzoate--CoA ligase [Halobacillus salinarum]|uniref:O-succinylbenzoate--CoA ligase n=1 Tax=Halobacillus salinarum TaxID=2932257 RepID=A0ABY4ENA0_9BACI|nr:o-succinylbenzoate--CoA ligase [Halobacillus salinarum]UOQ45092.1 o-succinylbenzoate--CoA ligase [Halobacillus salinarum]
MGPTLRSMFEQTVAKYPEKEALVDSRIGQRWTYYQWNLEVNKLANALSANGIKKGDKVSTLLFNTAEFATTLFACMKIGAIFNPINFRLSAKEVEFIVKDAKPKLLIFEKATAERVKPLAKEASFIQYWSIDEHDLDYAVNYYDQIDQVSNKRPDCDLDEDDIYSIMYTSGTTGSPKGVIHTHRDMMDQALIMTASMRLTKKDIGLSVAPMFHCAELHCAFLPRVLIGGTTVILHHFEADKVIETVREEQVTTFFAAPTMWNMMLQEDFTKEDFQTLRQGLYGGAPMAPALTTRLHEAIGIQLLQAYGMTEMGPAITVLSEDEQLEKAGSAGRPLMNHEVRVVRTREGWPSEPDDTCQQGELGEIIVRGPSMMPGYYNRPEASQEALFKGWYHTGDIGTFDQDGYLWVRDRLKDMIISGGENIYSREVEDTLFDHPGVLDVAVVGEPDETWGEKVTAYIVKKDENLNEQILDEFCKSEERLARYKRPRHYKFVNELPRNASGKLQKFKLREKATHILE